MGRDQAGQRASGQLTKRAARDLLDDVGPRLGAARVANAQEAVGFINNRDCAQAAGEPGHGDVGEEIGDGRIVGGNDEKAVQGADAGEGFWGQHRRQRGLNRRDFFERAAALDDALGAALADHRARLA